MTKLWGSRDGEVVKALASHQCVLGSIPGPGVICGLSLLLVLFLAPRGFSPGTPVFPSPQKPPLLKNQHFQFPIRPGLLSSTLLWASLGRVIAQALSVFDIKFAFYTFTCNAIRAVAYRDLINIFTPPPTPLGWNDIVSFQTVMNVCFNVGFKYVKSKTDFICNSRSAKSVDFLVESLTNWYTFSLLSAILSYTSNLF